MSRKTIKNKKDSPTPQSRHHFAETTPAIDEVVEEAMEAVINTLTGLGVAASHTQGKTLAGPTQFIREGVTLLENGAKMAGVGLQQAFGDIPLNIPNMSYAMAYLLASTYVGASKSANRPLSVADVEAIAEMLFRQILGLSNMIAKNLDDNTPRIQA
jgi:hypothetical protein